ncbi:hypothetical protein Tsubulata_021166 [Turnera subulata]|uniref:glycine--tRNA ligase n=1 Tax=Turnera subulata TaxID=218843 RepID=A0A9Q0GJH0_9ROSI|nr:hypothetical protein Tsubulata_021166 [Turnera subulata]
MVTTQTGWLQRHTQFQVILKPDPGNSQDLFILCSPSALGIDVRQHDIRFVEDNWESPVLYSVLGVWVGKFGWMGWRSLSSPTSCRLEVFSLSVEITYGLERILMLLQVVDHFKNIQYADGTTYGELFLENDYPEPSIQPDDSRYGENANGLQRHTQFQVILKPDPGNSQDLFISNLSALGIDVREHDIRFVEDNWESPVLGAWGLGWEIWMDGIEITQFTYFQLVLLTFTGVLNIAFSDSELLEVFSLSVEITYGLERILMLLQVGTVESYAGTMRRAGIEVEIEDLKNIILKHSTILAKSVNGHVQIQESLLNEVVILVELPVPVLGKFEESFPELSEDLLTIVMQKQQKYFSITGDIGRLLPYSIAEKLGTMLDKMARVQNTVAKLSLELGINDGLLQTVDDAASHAMSDLATAVVMEFTSLSGIMARQLQRPLFYVERIALFESYWIPWWMRLYLRLMRELCGALSCLQNAKSILPLEDFFNNVFVMEEDERIRNNRVALLKKIAGPDLPRGVADLTVLPGF